MKSLYLALAVVLLSGALVACSSTATTAPATTAPAASTAITPAATITPAAASTTAPAGATTGVVSPMIDYDSLEALNEAVGVSMVLPESATDIVYSSINDAVAQAGFTMDGIKYCLRLAPGSALEDISGVYLIEPTEKDMFFVDYPYQIFYDASGAGYALWYDEPSQVTYSIYMESGATEASLQSIAETLIPAG